MEKIKDDKILELREAIEHMRNIKSKYNGGNETVAKKLNSEVIKLYRTYFDITKDIFNNQELNNE